MDSSPDTDRPAAHRAGESVVVVRGEVDLATAPEVRRRLLTPAGVVVLDASAITFIDCAGLRAVLGARAVLAARGQELRLRAPSPALTRLVDWTGLGRGGGW